MEQNPFDQALRDVIQPLARVGIAAWICGGSLRDHLFGLPGRDVDIAADADATVLQDILGACEVRPGTYLARVNGTAYEISILKGGNIRADCLARDFTINALARDADGSILDFANGAADIANRILRATGDPASRFTEDPVRILRGVRFAVKYGLSIEEATKKAMTDLAPQILAVPAERILGELIKMTELGGPPFAECLRLMADPGILDMILPEVARMRDFEHDADTHPEGGPFEHTMKALEMCESADPDLLMSILLHDVGKGVTYARRYKKNKNAWRHTYYNHDVEGMRLIEAIGQRLKFPVKMTECAKYCGRHHMLAARARNMKTRKLLRLVASPYFDQLVTVCECDMLSRGLPADREHVADMRKYMAALAHAAAVAKRISGKTVMDALGLESGPQVGRILEDIRVFIVERILKTREEPSSVEIMRRLRQLGGTRK